MTTATEKTEYVSYLDHKGKYKGFFAWIFATDHKRIGLLYMYAIMSFFFYRSIAGIADED